VGTAKLTGTTIGTGTAIELKFPRIPVPEDWTAMWTNTEAPFKGNLHVRLERRI
jgi:hypothetical protein